jgi:hypothetical protein
LWKDSIEFAMSRLLAGEWFIVAGKRVQNGRAARPPQRASSLRRCPARRVFLLCKNNGIYAISNVIYFYRKNCFCENDAGPDCTASGP